MKDIDDSLDVEVSELRSAIAFDEKRFALGSSTSVRFDQLVRAEGYIAVADILGTAGEVISPSEVGKRVDRMIDEITRRGTIGLYDGWVGDIRRMTVACIKSAHLDRYGDLNEEDSSALSDKYCNHLRWQLE